MENSKIKTQSNLDLSYWQIIAIATPVLIANLAMPLQGAIDVAIVGHFSKSYFLAGLGIASQLWLLIIVSFNFLQYASSGLSAQALGKQQSSGRYNSNLAHILFRSLGLAVTLAIILWLLKPLIVSIGLKLLAAPAASSAAADTYLDIRYYGIVFELMNYAFIGWFAGQGKTKQMMLVQLIISVANIILTLTFVYQFSMGLAGVALGTVVGYAIGCTVAALLAVDTINTAQANCSYSGKTNSSPSHLSISVNNKNDLRTKPSLSTKLNVNTLKSLKQQLLTIYAPEKMLALFMLNKDIFIRTMLLTLSFAWITRLSALQGDLVMATNALLLQVLSISSFALDGVAVAAESLSGQALAHKDRDVFVKAIKRSGIVIFCLAILLCVIWGGFLPTFLSIMTDISDVYLLANDYRYVAIMLPLAGAGAYWLDGVMFGLTAGSKIRQVAIIVAVIFFPLTYTIYHSQIFGSTQITANAMLVIWFSVYWLLISRFLVAAFMLWRNQHSLIINSE